MQKTGFYLNIDFLSNLYIDCGKLVIQIGILYERSNFLWNGRERKKVNSGFLFGDTPRAFSNFNSAKLIDNHGRAFNVPTDVKRFLFDYDHSKFIECNKFLTKKNLDTLGDSYAQNEVRNAMITPITKYISNSLESYYKHYWLAGGTLLGKYVY